MELLLKNVQKKHLGLIAELARTLKITIEGELDNEEVQTNSNKEENQNIEDGLFLSWLNK